MRDFLPQTAGRRRAVIETIRQVYESYGFEPLETPSLENLEVLMGKYGEEGDTLLFKVLKRGNKLEAALEQGERGEGLADLGLRYDLTVPLARVMANYRGKLPRLFKRYQIQPVWRADRPAKGRYREFYQCDVDVVGSHSPSVEVELLSAACEALRRLGFDDFEVKLNHRKLLFGLLEAAGVKGNLAFSAVVALDKLDKIGTDGVKKELLQRGVAKETFRKILPLLEAPKGKEAFSTLAPLCKETEEAQSGLEATRQIAALCEGGPGEGRVVFDPCLARGLSYYTGSIFEIASPALGVSLAGGGRYDDLIGMFSGDDLPACGISLGLERILQIMEDKDLFGESCAAPHLVVTCWSEDLRGASITVASKLRDAGLRVDTHYDSGKIGKQIKYAQKRGSRFVAIVGPDEAAAGSLALKDLHTGDQKTLDTKDAAAEIVKLLGGAP